MINSAFGLEHDMPPPLDRVEVLQALLTWDNTRGSVVERNVAWCAYCDIRDSLRPGSSAQKFLVNTLQTYGFVDACHKRGWTEVKAQTSSQAVEVALSAANLLAEKYGIKKYAARKLAN